MIQIGIASDNFRHDDRSLAYVFDWCRRNACDTVEINTVNGEDFFDGLGFSPAISLQTDGAALCRELSSYGLKVSQLDCHYALSVMTLESQGEKNTLKSLEWFRGVLP